MMTNKGITPSQQYDGLLYHIISWFGTDVNSLQLQIRTVKQFRNSNKKYTEGREMIQKIAVVLSANNDSLPWFALKCAWLAERSQKLPQRQENLSPLSYHGQTDYCQSLQIEHCQSCQSANKSYQHTARKSLESDRTETLKAPEHKRSNNEAMELRHLF